MIETSGHEALLRLGMGAIQVPVEEMELLELAAVHPLQAVKEGTEFMRHLRIEPFYVDRIRDHIMQFPTRTITYWVDWGRTGAGKLTLAKQAFHLVGNDPLLNYWLRGSELELELGYISFAGSADAAKIEGLISRERGHGQYTVDEYAKASRRGVGFIAEQLTNPKNPKLIIVEPSGPTAQVIPGAGVKGIDRLYSGVHYLASYHPLDTFVSVIHRGPEVMAEIIKQREAEENATANTIIEVARNFKVRYVFPGGKKIEDLTRREREIFLRTLKTNRAPASGVIRSNRETDALMAELGASDEKAFWGYLLGRELGLPLWHTAILDDQPSDDEITAEEGLHQYDIPREYVKRLEALGLATP